MTGVLRKGDKTPMKTTTRNRKTQKQAQKPTQKQKESALQRSSVAHHLISQSVSFADVEVRSLSQRCGSCALCLGRFVSPPSSCDEPAGDHTAVFGQQRRGVPTSVLCFVVFFCSHALTRARACKATCVQVPLRLSSLCPLQVVVSESCNLILFRLMSSTLQSREKVQILELVCLLANSEESAEM